MTEDSDHRSENEFSDSSEFPVAYVLVPLWVVVSLLYVVGTAVASGVEGNLLFAVGLAVLAVIGIAGIYGTVKFVQEGVFLLVGYLGISSMVRLVQTDLLFIVDIVALFFLLRHIGKAQSLDIGSSTNKTAET